jgi:hypothetical protein
LNLEHQPAKTASDNKKQNKQQATNKNKQQQEQHTAKRTILPS